MKRVNESDHARFITFSTYQRLKIFSTDPLRDAFVEQLQLARDRHGFLLHAWVIMPDHAHLLIRVPGDGDPNALLKALKLGLSKRLTRRWKELDAPILTRLVDSSGTHRIWQRGGGYDRNIVSEDEFNEKVGYIHMNPVRAGLVRTPLEWKWSSARWWGGDRDGQIPCDHR